MSRAGIASGRWPALVATLLAGLLIAVAWSGTARAQFGVDALDIASADATGQAFTQAGGHPHTVSAAIELRTVTHPAYGPGWPAEPLKTLAIDLPPGLVGDPTAVARCALSELTPELGIGVQGALCPAASQVGVVALSFDGLYSELFCGLPRWTVPGCLVPTAIPVYNLERPPGVPARFGFSFFGVVVVMDAELRSGFDDGLSVAIRNVSQGLPFTGATLTLWGVPADPAHDPQRVCPGAAPEAGLGCRSDAPRRPFLTLPTACQPPGAGLETVLRVDSWFRPGAFQAAQVTSHLPPGHPLPRAAWGPVQGPSGCEHVPFEPQFTARPTTAASPGPSGWEFAISLPEVDEPDQVVQGHLQRVVVQLPEGVRLSPAAVRGLGTCAPGEIRLDAATEPACPDASKVGSVRIETPLLEEPLEGAIFLARPRENPWGSLLAVYVVARGPGVIVKLPGRLDADSASGRLTATFDELPQLPFTALRMSFAGGAHAALSNPPRCGSYRVGAQLTSWSGPRVARESEFTTTRDGRGAPCPPAAFRPGFAAGAANPVAGADSPFSLTLSRGDEDDELRTAAFTLPKGVTARIASVPLCDDARANAGACDEASRVGTVTAMAGPGDDPFAIGGSVYATGTYDGAPYGLAIVVPVVAGPFDLGRVVVRAAIELDRDTAQLRVVADPFPSVLEGIPLQLRLLDVRIDRPRFMVNPTSCTPSHVHGTVGSVAGAVADVSAPFRVGDCAALPFRPRLTLTVGRAGHTGRERTTPLAVTFSASPGHANTRSVFVGLPTTINARLRIVNQACSLTAFRAGGCGRGARVGSAVAVSPLLPGPLKGTVFFVRNPARTLPDLMIALRGAVAVDLVGRVTIPGGRRLAVEFDTLPDVPLSTFAVQLADGRNGPAGAVLDLCSAEARRRSVATLRLRAHSGRVVRREQRLRIVGCGRAGGRTRAARRARAVRPRQSPRGAARALR